MDGILEFLGSALVRTSKSGRVGLEIDLNIAAGRDVAGLLVVVEVVAVNLVEAGGIAAVENNTHVVQFGPAIQLELLKVAGFDGEQGPLAVGFGELKAIRVLLDINPNFVGNFLQYIAQAHARIEIRPRHHRDEEDGDHSQPASETVDWERHAGSSLQ